MGKLTLSHTAYTGVREQATSGGTKKVTYAAEERLQRGQGLDPLVDPKGPHHLGPVRLSLPRFEKQGELWILTRGVPMPEETLLDTTGSMGGNVDLAFESLPQAYDMLTSGNKPILGRYDVQIATAIFGDVEDVDHDPNKVVLCRTQFEMAEKIAVQMSLMTPGRAGCGNGKEDPQFGLFGAAYLTRATINQYPGMRGYHFTVSDEPVVPSIEYSWLKRIYGDDVLARLKENGFVFTHRDLPDTAQTVRDLQSRAHAFFLQVDDRADVKDQWTGLYGKDHMVMLPDGTRHLHGVKAVIIGLTEGVLDLVSAVEFLREHRITINEARQIVRAVSHIPLRAQTFAESFDKLPKAGDLFASKADLWPVDPEKIAAVSVEGTDDKKGINWL